MPKNQPPRRGPSQEERRRKAANRPLGGGGTPRQTEEYYKSSRKSSSGGIQRASSIVALVMLIAIVLSLVPSCFSQVGVASAMVQEPASVLKQDVARPGFSWNNSRYLRREAAESPPTTSLPRPAVASSSFYVGDTGHLISGPFLNFWKARGGTATFGNPISEEYNQNNFQVQLFEKALLEYHPNESDTKNQIQLAFLGRLLADARGLRFDPVTNTSNSATRTFFNETGQAVAAGFKTYWEKRDGLALLGLPISGEISEAGRTIQYFERGLLQTRPGSTEIETGDAGQALLEIKGWPRPTRMNLELNIAEDQIYQGRTLAVRLAPGADWEPQNLKGMVGDEALRIGRVGPVYRAFKAFAPWAEAKEYALQITYNDPAGRSRELSKTIKVLALDFDKQNLYLPDDKNSLTEAAADDYDNAQLDSAYKTFTPLMQWSGLWSWPALGEITTEFGQRRAYFDGKDYNIYHGGLDIAQPLGTPVAAPADSTVLYTGTLQARGNAVALDHGLGVTSYYYHLNSILVKPGDKLKKGQILGQVGTTGRSNGPHLHWEVRVNGVITYPQLFLRLPLSN